MSKKKLNKTVWYGSDVDLQGNAILPPLAEGREDLNGIHEGEIYLHNQDDDPGIWVRTDKGNIKRIGFNKRDLDLSEYLKKQVWDTAWELRTTEEGESYIFCKLPFISQYGITLYADGGNIDLPSLYAGIPVDGTTITKREDGTLMLNPNLELGGLDEEALQKYLDDYNYAKITDVDSRINDLVNGAPAAYDTLKEIADVLQGNVNSIGDIITTLGTKADKTYVDTELAKYIPIAGDTEVTGIKNFLNGLKVGGLPISKYEGHDDVIYIDANVVLRGGLTQYAVDPVTIPSIIESLPQAGYESKGVASFSSEYFVIDANGKVRIIPDSVGLNEEELEEWLANSDYTTKTYVDDTFATKSSLNATNTEVAKKWTQDNDKIANWDTAYSWGNHAGAGYFLASNFTKVNIVAKLGISDWALAATKPSYTTKEVTEDTNLYFTNQRAIDALTETLKAYVTLKGTQTIEGEKDFTGGLKVNGSPIVYDSENGYWLLQGNLLITGGLTQYVDDGSVDLPNLYDGLPIDNQTIYWEETTNGKVLKAKVAEGGITSITSQMVIDALGFTPYDASNPNGYITSAALNGYQPKITSSAKLAASLVSGLATVATSGSYNDLSNKPTIPSNTNQLTNGAGFITASQTLSNYNLSDNTNKLLSQRVWSFGTTNKGDDSTQNENPTAYGMYISLQYSSSKNMGFQIYGDTWGAGDLYTRYRNAGDGNTTYSAWRKILDETNYSSYALPLSGGTLSNSSFGGALTIHRSQSGNNSVIKFTNIDGELGFIGVGGANGAYPNQPMFTTGGFDYGIIHSGNIGSQSVASATKLQTARTIWGQSFDGSGNVNGNIHIESGYSVIGGSAAIIASLNGSVELKCGNVSTNAITFTTAKEFRPFSESADAINLGNSSYRWKNIYGNNIDLKSSSANIITIRRAATGGGAFIDYYYGNLSDSQWRVGGGGDGIFTFNKFSGTSESQGLMTISASGNVGIGTTSPAYKLDVNGSARINKFLTVGAALSHENGARAQLYVVSADANPCDLYLGADNTKYWSITARNSAATTSPGSKGFGIYNASTASYGMTISVSNNTTFNGNVLATGGITQYSDIRKKTKLQDVELTLKQVANAPLIEHYYNSDDKKTTHVGSIAQYWAEMNDWFCKLDSDGYYTMEIQNAALASAISIARELVRYESKTDKKIRLLKKRINELEDEIEILKKGA